MLQPLLFHPRYWFLIDEVWWFKLRMNKAAASDFMVTRCLNCKFMTGYESNYHIIVGNQRFGYPPHCIFLQPSQPFPRILPTIIIIIWIDVLVQSHQRNGLGPFTTQPDIPFSSTFHKLPVTSDTWQTHALLHRLATNIAIGVNRERWKYFMEERTLCTSRWIAVGFLTQLQVYWNTVS